MTVTVVAVLKAKPSHGSQVIDSFRKVSPLVHEEPGCELYTAHLEQGGDTVVMIERWSTKADLDAHVGGAPLRLLNSLNKGLLEKPYEVWFLDPVLMGSPGKGLVPGTPRRQHSGAAYINDPAVKVPKARAAKLSSISTGKP